jgi:hypothetical protein
MGPVGKDKLPDFRKNLKLADAAARAESATDLGFLGADAVETVGDLTKLLDDEVARVPRNC